jgi:hypothetical protein
MQRSKRRKIARLNGKVRNKAQAVRITNWWNPPKGITRLRLLRDTLGSLFFRPNKLKSIPQIEVKQDETKVDSNIPAQ